MKTALSLVLATAVLFCNSTRAIAQQTEITQKQLVQWITSGSQTDKETALGYVATLPPDRREPALEDALIKELERFNKERRRYFELIKEGKPAPAVGEGQGAYRQAVAKAVGESIDLKVIPALVGALGAELGAGNALARFGNDAAGPVAAAARASQPDFGMTSDALATLRLIVLQDRQGGWNGLRLSKDSVGQISGAARARLTGPQYFLNVIAAVDLAMDTLDEGLRARVLQLVDDPFQLRQMGITDAAQARRVHDAAFAALRR